MGKYDTTIRTILMEGCAAFMESIDVPEGVKPLPVKIPRVSAREVDYVGRHPKTKAVYHVEFQVGNDPLMSARMLVYAGQIGERIMRDEIDKARMKRKRLTAPPVFPEISSTLVYVGRDTLSMPDHIRTAALTFNYKAVDVRTMDADRLLRSEAVGDATLAILCRDGTDPAKVRQILERLKGLKQDALDRAYGQLLILSELRHASGVVETESANMNVHVDLGNIASVREYAATVADKAAREAAGKAATDATRKTLITVVADLVGRKFGDAVDAKALKTRLARMTDEALKEASLRVMEVGTVDEVFEDAPARASAP